MGLASPCGSVLRRGTPVSFNVAYWGSNICRAGWVAEEASDLPSAARDYVEAFAGPYFEAMAAWLGRLRIGATGGELAELIDRRLPFQRFGISLNPGHLVHLDEWLSSPISAGSGVVLRSGMAFQSDVIPSSPVYHSVAHGGGAGAGRRAAAGRRWRRSTRAATPAACGAAGSWPRRSGSSCRRRASPSPTSRPWCRPSSSGQSGSWRCGRSARSRLTWAPSCSTPPGPG